MDVSGEAGERTGRRTYDHLGQRAGRSRIQTRTRTRPRKRSETEREGVEESEHSERHALLVLRILGYLSQSFGKPAVSDGGKTIIAQDPASEFLTWRE